MKVVINADFGGFGLSDEAVRAFFKRKNWNLVEQEDKYGHTHFYKDKISDDCYFSDYSLDRTDSDLVAVVEELGERGGSRYSCLKIVEIPDDVKWHIHEYDGLEHVAEDHRTWS